MLVRDSAAVVRSPVCSCVAWTHDALAFKVTVKKHVNQIWPNKIGRIIIRFVRN